MKTKTIELLKSKWLNKQVMLHTTHFFGCEGTVTAITEDEKAMFGYKAEITLADSKAVVTAEKFEGIKIVND